MEYADLFESFVFIIDLQVKVIKSEILYWRSLKLQSSAADSIFKYSHSCVKQAPKARKWLVWTGASLIQVNFAYFPLLDLKN